LSVEDPLEVSKVIVFVVREENIFVGLDRVFSMFFEDILLDAIAIKLNILTLINILNCYKKGLPLILCEQV
jgi:hypothetical protein